MILQSHMTRLMSGNPLAKCLTEMMVVNALWWDCNYFPVTGTGIAFSSTAILKASSLARCLPTTTSHRNS